MKIFPAIDIIEKKCVRLIKGNFNNKTEYESSPVEQAKKYKDHGFKNILVEWCKENNFLWEIEHDIFICKKK